MKTLLVLALVLAAPIAATKEGALLEVQVVPGAVEFAVEFAVDGPSSPYFAGVLLSLSPKLAHYLVDLPPLLADHVIAGIGFVERERYLLSLPETALPPGVMIYAQGVTFDGAVIASSDVADFVLDASGEQ
ncbi:MAG: hypothetical protein ACK5AL_15055 [Planctomycetota bacterium]|jgi:hypothetical protein